MIHLFLLCSFLTLVQLIEAVTQVEFIHNFQELSRQLLADKGRSNLLLAAALPRQKHGQRLVDGLQVGAEDASGQAQHEAIAQPGGTEKNKWLGTG
jgi:hypothetical protein